MDYYFLLVINSMCCIHYPLFKLGTCNTKCEIMFLLEYEGHEDIGRLKQMDPSYKRVDLLNFFLVVIVRVHNLEFHFPILCPFQFELVGFEHGFSKLESQLFNTRRLFK